MEVKKKETKKQFDINDGFNGLEMRRKIKSKNESMGKIKWDYNLIIKMHNLGISPNDEKRKNNNGPKNEE